MICWLLLVLAGVPVPGRVPVLVSLFLSSPGQGFSSFMDLLVPPASGWDSGACLTVEFVICDSERVLNDL